MMQGIQACNPDGNTFLQVDRLLMLAYKYGVDAEAVKTEATLAKATLCDKAMDNICDVLCELTPLKLAFQNFIKTVQIAMTIGVTSAECERCFSALKIIKTYRRSTMNEDRLNDIAILSIEKDLSNQLDLDIVVQKFVSVEKNRRIELC